MNAVVRNGNGNGNGISVPVASVPRSSRETALMKTQIGSYGSEGDEIDMSYWDTAVLATGTRTHRLFTVPLGQAGKTLDDTNLTVAGQIPQGQNFQVHSIKIFYIGKEVRSDAEVQLIYDVLRMTTITVKLVNKEYMGQWGLFEVLGAASLIAMLPAAAGDNAPMILPRYHGILPLNHPIVLAALTPFEVTMTHHETVNTLLDGDFIKISLAGLMTRVS